MKTIKTIADLKRAVKVGAKIGYIHYNNRSSKTPAGEFISEAIHNPIREISIVMSHAFAIRTQHTDGTLIDSWVIYPKGKDCKIEGNKVTVFERDFRHIGKLQVNQLPMVPVATFWIEDDAQDTANKEVGEIIFATI